MSNYTDKILAKIQKEQQIKEAKEAQLNEPLSMASSDDADMDFEFDNSVSDGEFAESFFNDDANGDEVKIDLDEPDEVEEEFDTLDELREKEIKDKKKKKGRLGELEEQELEEQGIAATSNAEPVYVFSEEIPADLAYEDAIPADISDGNATHISIIDAVVQSETYEQQIVREQEEQERVITAAYDHEPSMELEMPQQQNRPEEISDVVSSVASSDVTEKFYSADEVSGMDEERKVLHVSNLADNMSDATEEQHTINVPHAVDEEKIINHVVDMSDVAEEQHIMNMPDAAAETVFAQQQISEALKEQQMTNVSGAVVEPLSHDVVMSDAVKEQYVFGNGHTVDEQHHTPEEYAAVKAASVIDNIVSAPETIQEPRVAHSAEEKVTGSTAVVENILQQASTLSEHTHASTVIDDIVADKRTQPSNTTVEPADKGHSVQELYNLATGDNTPNRTMQDSYIEQSGSNAGFDTRARVADMVADEQIKGATERYVSQSAQYIKEFSPEVQAILTSASSSNTSSGTSVNSAKTGNTEQHAYVGASSSGQENNARDTSSDKEARTKSVADDHVEQRETEVKQSAFKEQALHQFVDVANGINRQLQRAGDTAIHAVTHEIATSDKNTKAGFDDLKKATRPVAEAATLVGMAALASSYSDKMMLLGKAGANTDKLISEGKMSAEDLLLSKRDLNKQLKEAGVSGNERKSIIQNRTDIHDMIGVRSEMRSMVATGQIRVDDKLSAVLQSSDFFDMRNKQMGQLLQLYYKHSSDDVIRNAFGKGDFTGKSSASFRKFIRQMDKNEVSVNGRASIKMGKLAASRARSNRELSGHISMKLKGTAKSMVANVTSYDKNMTSGLKTYTTAGKTAGFLGRGFSKVLIGTRSHGYKGLATQQLRVVKKVMIGTKKHGYKGLATQIGRGVIRFAKYTDKSFYALTNHSIGHFVSVSQNNIRKGMHSLREGVRAGGEIAKKKAIIAAQQAKKKAANTAVGKQVIRVNTARINATNAAVAKYKVAQQAARKAAQQIAQTKAAKAAYATGNVVAKGANLFIGTPLRFGAGAFRKVKLAIGKVFSAINLIKKYIIMGAGIFCAVYIILVLAVMGMLSIFSQDNTAIMNILLPDRDEFVPESIERYLEKSEDIVDAAVEIGEGIPLTPEVTSGHTIDKYGHPDTDGSWVQGYKIFYTDSQGNIIQSGSNNVKDTLILAYVQMDADWKNEDDATDMMDKYFKWLNPNSDPDVMLENSEETDIYFCPEGCETVYYKCCDSAYLTNSNHSYLSQSDIASQQADGTQFYGTITSKSSGDYYVCYCNGHRITDANGNTYNDYHSSRTNGSPSGCDNYRTTYYCTGHSIEACYGHRDIEIYIPIKTMQDAFDENYMVSEHTFLTFLNDGDWTEDAIDWCWSLYNADWYDLYGIDPSGGVGFNAGGSLTQEEIDEILDNCGDASQLRQNLVATALSQVGSLPYYYGGKPTSGGIPVQTNRGQAGSTTNVADHIGRTIAGLDCFGFCQWVYWNTTGSNVMPEGSNATTTTVYNSSSYGNLTRLSGAGELKIGDLGFQAGHVGMFAGVSADGKLMWIHCSGGANTVVYGTYNGFTRYYRLNGLE